MAPIKKKTKSMKPIPTKKFYGALMKRKPVVHKTTKVIKRGASNSKSAGFVSPPREKQTILDRFQRYGIVTAREFGSVFAGSATDKVQSVGIHQTTAGKDQLIADISLALAKAIATQALKTVVESNNTAMVPSTFRQIRFSFGWYANPGASQSNANFDSVGNYTIQTFADAFAAWWKSQLAVYANMSFNYLYVYHRSVATTPAVPEEIIAYFDLKRSKIDLYSKSALKIQNRTVNTAGNDEADDVDNVPLYGKTYDGSGNYFQFQESYICPNITTQVNSHVFGNLATSGMAEPPQLSSLKRLNSAGKIKLDPGEIKTSILTFNTKLSLNRICFHLGKSDSSTNLLPMGKQRLMVLEKMLQAVATTDTTAIKVAYEIDLKCGTIFSLVKYSPTTQVISLIPQ